MYAKKHFLSGFPYRHWVRIEDPTILYLGYFMRKKDFKAIIGGIIGVAAAAIASVAVFGLQANRVFSQSGFTLGAARRRYGPL